MNMQRMVYLAVELLSSEKSYSRVCIFTRPACQGIASSKEVTVVNLKENACSLMEIPIYVSTVLFGLLLTNRSEFLGFLNGKFANKD